MQEILEGWEAKQSVERGRWEIVGGENKVGGAREGKYVRRWFKRLN